MKDVAADPKLVAYCGLYCGACGAYLRGRCAGCHENARASWCKVRTCCTAHAYASCADCADFADPVNCKKFHNLFSRLIGMVLRSDRPACIRQIKAVGLEAHAAKMAAARMQTIRR